MQASERHTSPLQMTVLVSGRGSNLQALIDAIDAGRLNARIGAVISNRPTAAALDRARTAGLDTVIIDHRRYPDRAAFDAALHTVLDGLRPDLVVMAGFMRVLGDDLVERFRGRLINIHPSLLPAYRGLDTHARVLAAGDREHGASVHFVTPSLDAGPVIAQARLNVGADDSPASLARRLLPLEHRLLTEVVALFVERSVELRDEQVYIDAHPLDRPLLLGRDLDRDRHAGGA